MYVVKANVILSKTVDTIARPEKVAPCCAGDLDPVIDGCSDALALLGHWNYCITICLALNNLCRRETYYCLPLHYLTFAFDCRCDSETFRIFSIKDTKMLVHLITLKIFLIFSIAILSIMFYLFIVFFLSLLNKLKAFQILRVLRTKYGLSLVFTTPLKQ